MNIKYVSLALFFLSSLVFGKSASLQEQADSLLSGEISIDEVNSNEVFKIIRGGDIIGNGGGLVELQFLTAFSSMEKYISRCLDGLGCAINTEDKKTLASIRDSLAIWPKDSIKFLFLSGRQYPRFFLGEDDVAVRTAKTGRKEFLPIFINSDHLYNASTALAEISYSQVISLVLHELGHQQKVRDHNNLNSLGNAIGRFVTKDFHEVTNKFLGSEMKLMAIKEGPLGFGQFWWSWKNLQVELTSRVVKKLRCKKGRFLIGSSVENLSWERSYPSLNGWEIGFRGWVRFSCQDKNGAIWSQSRDLVGGVSVDGSSRAGPSVLSSRVEIL